ncbi:adenylate/guanylate cyclase domain-containing protein [Actinoplanes sp. NPDC049681]|uniref:adenylate/guanylate cyclase domain-containing protein n=1 Tax=Actinoplanes sp. NPDC049681 TaxID=3363905 RepID=UPI0037B4E4F5
MSGRTELPSGLVTFVFTDIEGSTRLARMLGDDYGSVLNAHRGVVRRALRNHSGVELFTEGDSFFIAFGDAAAAVAACIASQHALAAYPWPSPDVAPRVRMGLHTGWAKPVAGEYASAEVHRAARVAAAAHGGQILCSEATALAVTTWSPDLLPAGTPDTTSGGDTDAGLRREYGQDHETGARPRSAEGSHRATRRTGVGSWRAARSRRAAREPTGGSPTERAGDGAAAQMPRDMPGDALLSEALRRVPPAWVALGALTSEIPATAPGADPDPMADVELLDLGLHRLRGFDDAERLFQIVAPGLERSFPHPRTGTAPNHNLPAAVTSFVGRQAEAAELRQLVGTHRLVTVAGSGGAGKTRLALVVAEQVLTAYPQGVWVVDLADGRPEAALAGAMGVRTEPGRPLFDSIVERCRRGRTLILLDTCDALPGDAKRLVRRLLTACPRLDVLATSRAPLGVPGELVWRLPPMAPADAYALLAQRVVAARGGRPGADEDDLGRVASRLDGHPLAIELAADRLRLLSATQLSARLDDPIAALDAGREPNEPSPAHGLPAGRSHADLLPAGLSQADLRGPGPHLADHLSPGSHPADSIMLDWQFEDSLPPASQLGGQTPPGSQLGDHGLPGSQRREHLTPGSQAGDHALPGSQLGGHTLRGSRRGGSLNSANRPSGFFGLGIDRSAIGLFGMGRAAAGLGYVGRGQDRLPYGDSRSPDMSQSTAWDRHHSLTRNLDWSYRGLSGAAAALLRRLAVFAGPVELAAVEWSSGDAFGALSELADRSLVEVVSGPRYRMPEQVRAYAVRRLLAAGEERQARDGHVDWSLHTLDGVVVDTDGQPRTVSLTELSPYVKEWEAALRWSVTGGNPRAGLRLVGALDPWWREHGGAREGRDLLYRLYGRLDGLTVARADMASAYLVHAGLSSDRDERERFLDRAEVAARAAGDSALVVRALAGHRVSLIEAGRLREAEQVCREVIAAAERTGVPAAALPTIIALAELLWRRDELDEAAELLGGARVIEAGRPEDRGRRTVDWLLGMVALRRGDLVAAHDHLVVALRSRLRHGFRGAAADAVAAIAVRCALGDDPVTAAVLFGGAESVRGARRATQFGAFWSAQQAVLRRRLGDTAFDAAYAEGATIGFTRAVATALAVEHPDLEHGSARFAQSVA